MWATVGRGFSVGWACCWGWAANVGEARPRGGGLAALRYLHQIHWSQGRVLCQQLVDALGRGCVVDGCQVRVPLKVGAGCSGGKPLTTAC